MLVPYPVGIRGMPSPEEIARHRDDTTPPGASAWVEGAWPRKVIDIDLTVADSSDEDAWLPPLEAAGLALVIRASYDRAFRASGLL